MGGANESPHDVVAATQSRNENGALTDLRIARVDLRFVVPAEEPELVPMRSPRTARTHAPSSATVATTTRRVRLHSVA